MVKVEIKKTGFQAFDDGEGKLNIYEVKRIFDKIISQMEWGKTEGDIIDYNGNLVGNWKAKR